MATFKNLFDRPPDFRLTWETILHEGLRSLPSDVRGILIAVHGDEVLYVGRCRKLPRFVGNFIAALLNGVGEHERPGGARIYAAGIPPKEVEFLFYFGALEYTREIEAIDTLKPLYNRKFQRSPDGQWNDSMSKAAKAGTPEAEHEATMDLLRSILRGPKGGRREARA